MEQLVLGRRLAQKRCPTLQQPPKLQNVKEGSTSIAQANFARRDLLNICMDKQGSKGNHNAQGQLEIHGSTLSQ